MGFCLYEVPHLVKLSPAMAGTLKIELVVVGHYFVWHVRVLTDVDTNTVA